MVFDHKNQNIYMAKSERTSELMVENLLDSVKYYKKYRPIYFDTKSSSEMEFYHTNVVMSVGEGFVVVCLSCLPNEKEKNKLLKSFEETGLEVIDITLEQTEKYFCGNLIQLRNKYGEKLIVMSDSAKNGFSENQKNLLSKFGNIITLPISNTIESIGGGSARCMIAEIFLPNK
jgi:hypothetical protein